MYPEGVVVAIKKKGNGEKASVFIKDGSFPGLVLGERIHSRTLPCPLHVHEVAASPSLMHSRASFYVRGVCMYAQPSAET